MGFIGSIGGLAIVISVVMMRYKPSMVPQVWRTTAAAMMWAKFGVRLTVPAIFPF